MISVDWINKIVDSDSDITDMIGLRSVIRALEMSEEGILYSPIIKYKLIDLGGGTYFPAIEFINGYVLRFPIPGDYIIKGGNLFATIVPVSGVFVNRTQSAAYAVSTGGVGSLSTEDKEDIAKRAANKIIPIIFSK